MHERFLQAKHWQLFLLTFGIPFILQIVLMVSMFLSAGWQTQPNQTFMISYVLLFPFVMLVFIGVFFGWFWAVAVGLQKKVPEGMKLKVGRFKFFFFTPIIYIMFLIGFMVITIMSPLQEANPGPALFAIVPLHFFSMFCIFYCIYFVSKTFKTVELQQKVSFSDFAGEFFMIWFFPIGIWIIQPKINKMIEQ